MMMADNNRVSFVYEDELLAQVKPEDKKEFEEFVLPELSKFLEDAKYQWQHEKINLTKKSSTLYDLQIVSNNLQAESSEFSKIATEIREFIVNTRTKLSSMSVEWMTADLISDLTLLNDHLMHIEKDLNKESLLMRSKVKTIPYIKGNFELLKKEQENAFNTYEKNLQEYQEAKQHAKLILQEEEKQQELEAIKKQKEKEEALTKKIVERISKEIKEKGYYKYPHPDLNPPGASKKADE